MKLLHRSAVTLVNAALLLAVGRLAFDTNDTNAEQAPPEPAPVLAPAEWSPPAWFPEEQAWELAVLPALDAEPTATRGPKVRAQSAIIADLDTGEILWARNADVRRPVASLTKMVSALAMASEDPDMDAELCVTPEQWPARPGARSRFETGSCHDGWSFLGAALVASDNRGAYGLAGVAGLPFDQFVGRMNRVSAELGLHDAEWVEPSGLDDDNMASARDLLKAVVAVAAHPVLHIAASAPSWDLFVDGHRRDLGTTNRLHGRWEVLGAKTGYTDTAHWCFAQAVRTATGRRLATVVLGAPTNDARFADTAAMIAWAEGGNVDIPRPRTVSKPRPKPAPKPRKRR